MDGNFLTCIKMFLSLEMFTCLPPLSLASSFRVFSKVLSRSSLLILVWCDVMVGYKMISFFIGRVCWTSHLSLRRRKGLRMLCSFSTILECCKEASSSSWDTFEKSNHFSKSAREVKTSGSKKLSRDHSSLRLFCRGVPVSKSLLAVSNSRKDLMSLQLKFFSLWPSSTTMYL